MRNKSGVLDWQLSRHYSVENNSLNQRLWKTFTISNKTAIVAGMRRKVVLEVSEAAIRL